MRTRKETRTERAANLKMNSDVYALRTNVMKTVYEASRIAGYRLPRVEVRIVENSREFIGLARMSDGVIWITEKYAKNADLKLKTVVLHEMAHALFGTEHDEICPLMGSVLRREIDEKAIEKAFRKYANA